MNVGVSIFAAPGANIWSSGINQNLAYLLLLLRRCPNVEGLFLLNGGNGAELPAGMGEAVEGVPLVRPDDVTHRIDCVIEMGAQLPLEWMRHVRALGARLVLFLAGHSYASAAEGPIFGRQSGLTFTGAPWHEVWMLPQHMHTGASMMRTLARVPVHEMPHLWSPVYLQKSIAAMTGGSMRFGIDLERRERRAGWRAGIFEPNISVVKNCVMPMLACDHAYRRDRESVELMMVMNSMHMKEHPSFNSLAAGLDLTREGRASYEPRIAFAECMARHSLDAVVSHQWECGLNYLYYDALYGGYPLIHNSDFLRDAGVGIHYPGFDASAAGEALVRARQQGPDFWQDYAASAKGYLATLAPDHPSNVEAFLQRLTAEGSE
jgi:hypothetical protein